jgi:transposase InsO family protein
MLRMDHGSQYTSDDFRNQLKFWGDTASFAFVAEPQTNGVAERFNRTLKEQAIMVTSSKMRRRSGLPPSRSRTVTIATGVLKN